MNFDMKGWSAVIAIVVVLAVLKFFNAGVMHDLPTPEQVRDKAGKQIEEIIFAEAVFAQTEMLEQAKENGQEQAAIKQAQAEFQSLKQITLGSIEIEPFSMHRRDNMLRRETEFLIRVGYTVGNSDLDQSVVLELDTFNDAYWVVSRTIYPF